MLKLWRDYDRYLRVRRSYYKKWRNLTIDSQPSSHWIGRYCTDSWFSYLYLFVLKLPTESKLDWNSPSLAKCGDYRNTAQFLAFWWLVLCAEIGPLYFLGKHTTIYTIYRYSMPYVCVQLCGDFFLKCIGMRSSS